MLHSGGDGKPATAPTQTLARRTALASATRRPRDQARSLTPQFHWNLNDSALRCLSDDERAALYQLFRFYDSSFQGDALPAIHLPRFVELLRDAQLLARDDGECDDGDDELQPATVEKVFAQAVLGKLRTYLDADDEPALTFQLFGGALFHCATIKFPDTTPPEQAFRRLVEIVLTLQPHGGLAHSSRGLVQHAEHAAIPSWSVQDLYHDHQLDAPSTEPPKLFLERPVFQQVVAGLSHDKLIDEQRRARLEELYVVPEELTTHFNADAVRFITERFRTFDVFDRGVLPRDEVFALLSGMAKKLEITDVYEVLAVILAGELGDRTHLPRGSLVLSAPSKVTHVSLAQVVHALHVCRRARTASYHLGLQNQARKLGGVAAAQAKLATADTTGAADTAGKTGNASGKKGTHGAASRAGKVSDKKAPAKGKASGGSNGASGTQHKATSPTKSSAKTSSSQPSVAAGTVKRAGAGNASGKAKEKKPSATAADAGLLRRLSKMSASSSEASTVHAAREPDDDARGPLGEGDAPVRQDSFRSASSSSSAHTSVKAVNGSETSALLLPKVTVNAGASQLSHHPADDTGDAREELEQHATSQPLAAMAKELPPALTLRLFHTHGQAHPRPAFAKYDGAICLTIQLFLAPPPSRIVSSQGVHFSANGDRDEVWSTETLSLDEKLPLEAAVVALKTLVAEKERVGFELVPDLAQREAMDTLMREIRDAKCPRYAAALHSPKKGKRSDQEPKHSDDYVFRRDGVAVRPSLDRGSTWVREASSSDLLGTLSDPKLHKDLQAKKRQMLLASRTSGLTNQRGVALSPIRAFVGPQAAESPTLRRPCELPRAEPPYDQVVRSLGLCQPEGAWISALNPESFPPPSLRSSQSLPQLAPRPLAASSLSRR